MSDLKFKIGDYVKDKDWEDDGLHSRGKIVDVQPGEINRYKLSSDGKFHNENNLVEITKEESEVKDSHPFFKKF